MPGNRARLRGVCLLAESFHPIVGGGETHARLLSVELARTGLPALVLTRRILAESPPLETLDGVQVIRVPPTGAGRAGKYLMMLPALRQLIARRADYDLVYVCGLRVLGVLGVVAARLLGKRCVLRAESNGEVSGAFMETELGGSRPLLRRVAYAAIAARNRLLLRADAFISISRTITDELTDCGARRDRIIEIPNGIPTARFHPVENPAKEALRRELGLPVDRRLWCYSGKLNRGKGLEMLLRVWRDVAAVRPDLHLVLIGGGAHQHLSCEAELREYVRANSLGDRVTFTGYVEQVSAYLQACDYFVLPSDSEALPLSLVEAMATGLPAVATRVGGIPDVVRDRDDGWLIPPGDEAALRHAVLHLSGDPALSSELGQRALASAGDRFDIRVIAERHLETFVRVAAR